MIVPSQDDGLSNCSFQTWRLICDVLLLQAGPLWHPTTPLELALLPQSITHQTCASQSSAASERGGRDSIHFARCRQECWWPEHGNAWPALASSGISQQSQQPGLNERPSSRPSTIRLESARAQARGGNGTALLWPDPSEARKMFTATFTTLGGSCDRKDSPRVSVTIFAITVLLQHVSMCKSNLRVFCILNTGVRVAYSGSVADR